MVQGFRDFLRAWEDFRGEAEDYRELDGERVLVLTQFLGRGRTSGLELEQMRVKGAVPNPRRRGDAASPLLGPRPRVRRPWARPEAGSADS
jgi:hypothetical protein